MKTSSFCARWAVFFLGLACLTGLPGADTGWRLIPPFAGDSLPAPPQQTLPWSPPASHLDPKVTEATASLFAQGLGDPRGCDYREISVAVGDCWSGGGGSVDTHGWVLPAREGVAANSFAVCWNGLIYPLVSAGKPVDLRADIAKMLKVEPDLFFHGAAGEGQSVMPEWPTPLKVAFLLRLGQVDLAERVWNDGQKRSPNNHATDPYLLLVGDWAWSMYDRAICAHMRGDDKIALLMARQLTTLSPKVDAEGARRGSTPPAAQEGRPANYLEFLANLPELLADQERRDREPARAPTPATGARAMGLVEPKVKTPERIAELIRDLDQVKARQWGQPGGVSLGEDRVVAELVGQGDAAVEPLLQCLEQDERLTRSVHFWRDFARSRNLIGVHEAAYVALAGILRTSFFETASTGDDLSARGKPGRKKTAERIREYWEKNKALSLEDRWYATLSDDQAGMPAWLQAVGNIVQPTNTSVIPGSMVWTTTVYSTAKPGEVPPMAGEKLRAKTNPTVSDLISRRMEEAAATKGEGESRGWEAAARLAKALAAWDGPGHVAELADFTKRLEAWGRSRPGEDDWHNLSANLVSLWEKRLRIGDPTAIKEYADWLEHKPRAGLYLGAFSPAWIHAEDPVIRQVMERLFVHKSEWTPFYHPLPKNSSQKYPYNSFEGFVISPLLANRSFRSEVERCLADDTKFGSISFDSSGSVALAVDNGWSGWGGGDPIHDPDALPVGAKAPLRVNDYTAALLAELPGFPEFKPYWKQAMRDRARAQVLAHLQRYGDRYGYDATLASDPFDRQASKASFRLPPLTTPATPEDVRAGRAIFALTGERRILALPEFPAKAEWPSLKTRREISSRWDAATQKSISTPGFDTRGEIWQAEEQMVDGKWRRFFGFVGAGCTAKASAAEIVFPDENRPLEKGWSGQLKAPSPAVAARPRVGDPIPFAVVLSNRSGEARTMSSLPPDAGAVIPEGIKIGLEWADVADADPIDLNAYGYQVEWKAAPPRPGARSIPATSSQNVESRSSLTIWQGNVTDFFPLDRPGAYRLTVSLSGPRWPVGAFAQTFRVAPSSK